MLEEIKWGGFIDYQSDPEFLLSQRIGDLIPQDDLSWVILEVVVKDHLGERLLGLSKTIKIKFMICSCRSYNFVSH
jgi:hypothetical protein